MVRIRTGMDRRAAQGSTQGQSPASPECATALARAESRVAPRLDDDVRTLVHRPPHGTVSRDRGDHEADQLADLRYPGTERRPEAGVRPDRVRALAGLARRGAAVDPLAGAAIPLAADAREVPLVRIHAEVGIAAAERPRGIRPARIGVAHTHRTGAAAILLDQRQDGGLRPVGDVRAVQVDDLL